MLFRGRGWGEAAEVGLKYGVGFGGAGVGGWGL